MYKSKEGTDGATEIFKMMVANVSTKSSCDKHDLHDKKLFTYIIFIGGCPSATQFSFNLLPIVTVLFSVIFVISGSTVKRNKTTYKI